MLLVAILAGLPWALLALGMPYLPDHLPSVAEASAALYGIQDGRLLLGALVVGGWLAWVYLVVSTVIELVAALHDQTHRPRPGRRRAGRALTGVLVMWLMAAFTSQAVAAPALAAPVTSTAPGRLDAEHEQTAGPQYTVRDRDTLWDIASRELGDPLRWREILEINVGREQPDGGRLTTGALLRTGWILELPVAAPPPDVVTVRRGDTLAAIAARTLHDSARFPELFDANVGRPQPDGQTLRDANVIRPGWLLRIPQAGPPGTVDIVPPPHEQPRTSQSPSAQPTTPQPTTPPSTTTTVSAPTRTPPPTVAQSPPADSDPSAAIITWGGAGLAAAGIVGALALLRRRQQRARRYRHQIAVPSSEPGRYEVAAAETARPSDADLITLALCSLPADTDPPDLRAVMLHPDGVELDFADQTQLPPPYLVGASATSWLLPVESGLALPDEPLNPYPAVVAIGAAPGRLHLIDLEHHGVVHLDGHPERARDLLRSIVVELGTSRWADATEIITNGLDPDLARLPYSRVRHLPHPADAVATGTQKLRLVESCLAPDDVVVTRRRAEPWSDAWVVTVVALADLDAHEDLPELLAHLHSGPRRSVVFLLANGPTDLAGYRIHVHEDGAITTPDTTPEGLIAEQMSATFATNLLDVIGTTYAPDQPVPAAAEDQQSWATDMAADGAWTPPAVDVTNPWQQTMLFDAAPRPESPPPAEEPTELPQPTSPVVDPAVERALQRVQRDDPDLDADLARWHSSDTPPNPLVGILGPPLMRAPGTVPASRRPWFLEIAVYLALHPRGVSADKLATDLWPADRQAKESTVRRALVDVRAWAGHAPDDPNDFYLPAGTPGVATQYRLTRFLLDWDLFRRLRKRANALAKAGRVEDAVADYSAALQLIRGPILRSEREHGYGWLRNPDQHLDSIIPGWVVDTAHELVDLTLEHRDLDTARWAAEASRLADPDLTHDRPLLDLMRIAHAEGNLAEMREHADLLLSERGFEVGEDLPSESFAVFHELFPHGIDGRR
ncbi:LysM peptidoglycan-binding domain-containing protein [Pseudonocardia oroxyli]|uniref:LysM peptidoglycan-binding domain-containing protein n=1 Tax=Pseudonocardia oroxyli TaxID=366584 RepID=UPI0015A382C1|nr:LysM peptidoglycan-binding domain-containing protein [Pseudonocardia oroxyli]